MNLGAREFYDGLGEDYDRMVSWEDRLAREEPFFRAVFAEHGVSSVLDVACGTGGHAVAFAGWGISATAVDVSPVMIAKGRERARAAGVEVSWAVAAFGGLAAALAGRAGTFDGVTCLGNSLPHLPDDASLIAALADMAAMLRPGGVLVLQNRNYDRVLRERLRFMPISARGTPGDEILFIRITDFLGGDRLAFTVLTLRNAGGSWTARATTTPLRGIERTTLEASLARAGYVGVTCFGDYGRAVFDAPGTADLVAVAVKPA